MMELQSYAEISNEKQKETTSGDVEQTTDMGNTQDSGDDLRDDQVVPQNISKVTSNVILAMYDGNFFPCVILRNAETIKEGYAVYFLHNNEETEIPSTNVIGNLRALVECEVNFVDDQGNVGCGVVRATDCNTNDKQPMNFLIAVNASTCKWISLPFIFMTKQQATVLF